MEFQLKNHKGLTFWYNTTLISFAVITIALTWTVMNSGLSSSEMVRDVVEEAVKHSANGLQVVGKMIGAAEVTNNKVTVTATPVTATTSGQVNVTPDNVKVTYMIIKDGSHAITYDNIYVGTMQDESFNSLNDALIEAKKRGLVRVNPLVDSEKPDTTSAFMYWIINQDFDSNVQNNEIASLVVIYADKDRPSTGEYLRIQVVEEQGILLTLERIIPNISSSILDLGGKVKDKT